MTERGRKRLPLAPHVRGGRRASVFSEGRRAPPRRRAGRRTQAGRGARSPAGSAAERGRGLPCGRGGRKGRLQPAWGPGQAAPPSRRRAGRRERFGGRPRLPPEREGWQWAARVSARRDRVSLVAEASDGLLPACTKGKPLASVSWLAWCRPGAGSVGASAAPRLSLAVAGGARGEGTLGQR